MNGYSRWTKWMLILLGILLLFIMGISVGGRSRITILENFAGQIISPVQKVFYNGSSFISSKVSPVLNVWSTMDENAKLEKENQELKNKLIELSITEKEMSELARLEAALNYTNNMKIDDFVTANVIAKDAGNWYNMFTIDVGLKDGIEKDSTVINGDGLVGLVYEVGDTWAKVVSIIDHRSSIGFETLDPESDFDGSIKGSVDSKIVGYLFDPQANIKDGENIITSGLGIHPKGILIGEVEEVIRNKDTLLVEVVVNPAVNFRKLSKVLVIPYKEKE